MANQIENQKIGADTEADKAEVAERQALMNEALARRQEKADNPAPEMSLSEIRAARARLLAGTREDNIAPAQDQYAHDGPEGTAGPAIPVRHDGEEPGEADKGEDPNSVKIREDVKDFVPQPPEHRVPGDQRLHGETGEGATRDNTDLGDEVELGVDGKPIGSNTEGPDGGVLDPEGKEKGLKTLSDGITVDSQADQNSAQPAEHDPNAGNVAEAQPAALDLDALREEYKTVFQKPANTRWSAEHLKSLIDTEKAKA